VRRLASIAAFVALTAFAGTASADPRWHWEQIGDRQVRVVDTPIQVTARNRPSVVYVATARAIEYRWQALHQDLVPLILATVTRRPF